MITALAIYSAFHCLIIDTAIIVGVIKVYTAKRKIQKSLYAFRKEK